MLLSSAPVNMAALNRRLVVAVVVALGLGVLVARAVSGPERPDVPVIQLDRGERPPTSATTPIPEPGAGPGTTGEAIEPAPPMVPPTPPLDTPVVPPQQPTPGTVLGDDDEDAGRGGDDGYADDRPDADDDDGVTGGGDDDGGEDDDD